MRTNIDIDDALLKEAMAATGLTTKKATVEEALRRLLKDAELRQVIQEMRGLGWEGDLDAMRTDRAVDHQP
ncbi:transcriptional regulator [Bosea sp. AAP35]|uniref:type II toxin-antitoxin system VapB family antitoxin n=1 Tax=Bosea sp. AAP35 TaxID=1523417 RepID=UPI0006B9BF26|nr:type II toxin-antitoxin system VapB family antitoxin [Bosea sp. AAP35]KPF63175.1 transcriptional regulator [Bosea sp. AAP35]